MSPPRIVVVGGGLGGLAVALRLAAAGAGKITVCERGERPGGKLNLLEREGFRFDTGPSLITLPEVFAELFSSAGEELPKHLALRRLDPHAEYVYPHGTRFAVSPNLPAWLATLGQLGKGEPEAFLELLALGARIYGVSQPSFLTRPVTAPPDRAVLRSLRRFPLRGAWGNYAKTVESIAKSPELRQLYLRYPTYVGSSPWACPATLLVIPYLEFAFGAWAVEGGLYRIAEVLSALLAARGVELRTGAEVAHIERSGGRVSGVRLASGERLPAEIVVTNADAAELPRLLGEGDGGLAPAERSLSGLVFLLGVKRDLPELAHHTVYFSADYRREFDDLFVRRDFPDDPTVYVNAASRTDRSVVPGGAGETLFVMANTPAEPGRWGDREIESARERVFARLAAGGFPELGADVVVEDVWTPARLAAAYRAPGGAIYGTHSHGWRRAFLRPANRVRSVRGLYRVGGSAHPGGGTPTVLLSARITAGLVLEDLR